MEHFGARFKRFRDVQGWSQEQIGFELNVSKATVSKWESGRAQPRLENLSEIRRLVARYGLSLDYLIDGIDEPAAGRSVHEAAAQYSAGEARNADEAALLAHFRALKPARRKALLAFIAG